VLLRAGKLLVVLGLSLSLSLHWTVLQSVAWMSMFVQYSQDGLPKALTKTFDGKHPCDLCKMVQKGKQTESAKQKAEIKFDPLLAIASISVPPPPPLAVVSHNDSISNQRVESPPHPPPRFA
jgi:hypothetical protein